VKLLTVLGTRPEIIRLSRVIPAIDAVADHVLVDTGQNFERSLSGVFYEQLGVRAPDRFLGVRAETFAARIAAVLTGVETALAEELPDALLVLGDTDSGLSAFVAKRMGIPVFHMEAGNRCFDERVPEEVNRRVIDHSSDVLMPYTRNSARNLEAEGIAARRIVVTGNPIREVLDHYADLVDGSDALDRLGLEPRGYVLLTAHRQENVDRPDRLASLLDGVIGAAADSGLPLVASIHPRTEARLLEAGRDLAGGDGVIVTPPLPFADFVRLEREARYVLTDSGTVQEECCLFGVPAVTVRDTTERPETVECGSNLVSTLDPGRIRECAARAFAGYPEWRPPPEYLVEDVSAVVRETVLARTTG
jgi:UDP-N-acetylglucosamine 2-epimerase (non-hydrolysing)